MDYTDFIHSQYRLGDIKNYYREKVRIKYKFEFRSTEGSRMTEIITVKPPENTIQWLTLVTKLIKIQNEGNKLKVEQTSTYCKTYVEMVHDNMIT